MHELLCEYMKLGQESVARRGAGYKSGRRRQFACRRESVSCVRFIKTHVPDHSKEALRRGEVLFEDVWGAC